MAVQGPKQVQPLRAQAIPGTPYRPALGSAQYQPSEIRLHVGVVAGAARIPAPRSLDECRAHIQGLPLARRKIFGTAGMKSTGHGARMAAQLQAPKRTHRHALRGPALCQTLDDALTDALVVKAVSVAVGARRSHPLLTPLLHLLARAPQPWI